jgi:hypothetical protein
MFNVLNNVCRVNSRKKRLLKLVVPLSVFHVVTVPQNGIGYIVLLSGLRVTNHSDQYPVALLLKAARNGNQVPLSSCCHVPEGQPWKRDSCLTIHESLYSRV